MKFNTAHPQDFTGHSLSVSDIVVLRQQGEVKTKNEENGYTEISILKDGVVL